MSSSSGFRTRPTGASDDIGVSFVPAADDRDRGPRRAAPGRASSAAPALAEAFRVVREMGRARVLGIVVPQLDDT